MKKDSDAAWYAREMAGDTFCFVLFSTQMILSFRRITRRAGGRNGREAEA